MTLKETHRRNMLRNMGADWLAWYDSLPAYHEGMVVKCATHNSDGTPIAENDIPGCGSTNVIWAGDVYDCRDCGVFFSDYAADPPHRRTAARRTADY